PHDDSDDFVAFMVGGNDTSFTAGEQDVDIVAGEILAQIGTSLVGDLPATCTPNGDNVLATVTVEDPEPEDTVAPVISLNGDNPRVGKDEGVYTVAEAAGNEATETRTVNVVEADGNGEGDEDTEAPILTLNGDNPMELEVGSTYDEPGATAEDNVDGDVTEDI